jgi:tRNA (guanine37-N1)-methyltransferase
MKRSLQIDVATIFPEMFAAVLGESIIRRAQESGRVRIGVHNIRDHSDDKHRKVDDRPYGGGSGMVMAPQPIFSCVETILKKNKTIKGKRSIILLSPRGPRLDQSRVRLLSRLKHIVLVCGRYEGVDERVSEYLCDEELSIGDYVLTGGELPAMVVIDSIVRLVPGVLGNAESIQRESFEEGMLEYPQYTRPPVFRGWRVPAVLRSGDHPRIEAWRLAQAKKTTRVKRPDLLE